MNLTRLTNNLTFLNAKTCNICIRFSMCHHMALVVVYQIIEDLSYFLFLQDKTPKYFAVRNKVSFVIPVSEASAATQSFDRQSLLLNNNNRLFVCVFITIIKVLIHWNTLLVAWIGFSPQLETCRNFPPRLFQKDTLCLQLPTGSHRPQQH